MAQDVALTVPFDFTLNYSWNHGSYPGAHDYTITIPNGGPGRFAMVAVNPVLQERHVWRVEFPVQAGPLQKLYQVLEKATESWCQQSTNIPRGAVVGGPYVTLEAAGGGKRWSIQEEDCHKPEYLAYSQQLMEAVTGMVPAETMAKIEAERIQYQFIPTKQPEAARWFRKYALQGYPEAMRLLGRCFFQGEGVAQDIIEAYAWYVLAAARRNGLAERDRDFLTKRMDQQSIQEGESKARSIEAQIVQN
jgi:hypothetical protein